MFFSILIANLNNGKYLREAIQSVLQQTYQDFEIIIVDDGSIDNSRYILDEFSKDERIKIEFLTVNHGQGYTKRRLIELSSGDILGYLDSDDALVNNALEIMYDAHRMNPDASLIYSQNYVCDENLKIKFINSETQQIENSYLEGKEYSVFPFATFKRNALIKIELWNFGDRRAMDQDLYYKLEEVGSLIFIKHPLYFYRRHSLNLTSTDGQVSSLAWHIKYIYEACERRGQGELFPIIISRMLGNRERSIIQSTAKKKSLRHIIKRWTRI